MSMRINQNVLSIMTQGQLASTSSRLEKSIEKLSSGLRINRAADDAAGLAIVEGFRAQVAQANQEIANLQTGVNVVETAEGALSTQEDAVLRIRELAVQAANGTLTDDQRAALNQEAQQLVEQIGETAENTEFNGQQLLNGAATAIDLGTAGNLQIAIQESTVASLGLNGLDLTTQAGAQNALGAIDTALGRINENRASLGAQENRFASAIEVREEQALNVEEAASRIRDIDIARQTIEQTRNNVLLQGGLAALAQSNIIGQNASRLLGG